MNEKEISKELKSMRRVKQLLAEKTSAAEAEEIFMDGEKKIREAWSRYEDASEELVYHLKMIIPRACIYNAIKEKYPEQALDILVQCTMENAHKAAKLLRGATKLPGTKALFINLFEKVTKKKFGEKAGFRNIFYNSGKHEFRMDILECPYCRYFAELGAAQLAKYSCECDDIVYGRIPGIDFIRTQTLAKGGEKCDFDLKLAEK